MILAIDIGNTNITIGCVDECGIYLSECIASDKDKTSLEYVMMIDSIIKLYKIDKERIQGAIISSVVPPLTKVLREAVERITRGEIMVVGAGLKMGLNIKMDDPKSVGSDQIVCAVAGLKKYGAPLMVVDMDTATTILVIDNNSNYIGGIIAPGVGLSMKSLAQNAAQLYETVLEAPKHVIGKNTAESMKSGIVLGCASMVDGMIERMNAELGYDTKVVATGKYASAIVEYCRKEIITDNNLLMNGLWIIYEKNCEKTNGQKSK